MLGGKGVTMAQRIVSAVRLNRKGIGTLLRDDLGKAATAKAHEMADEIRNKYPDLADAVDVEEYTTDRGAASVMVKDGAARELQVREGLMTRAAAAVGLEVTAQ